MASERDLYADLGVQRGAPEDEIRKAYRRLARKYHPDVNPDDPKAEERFKEISFAWDVLSDPEKRKLYDEFGVDALSEGFDPEQARTYRRWQEQAHRSPFHREFRGGFETGSLDDLLGELFGARAGARAPRRGADVEGEVEVDFLDAVRGGEVRVQVQRPGGPGEAPRTSSLRVKIPPGASDGTRVRLAGQGGGAGGSGEAGDLYLRLRVRPHPFFRREGNDLTLDLPVTLPELIRGAEVEVPTPDGRVTMTIPPRSQNGRRLRVRGKGVAGPGDRRGDLIVRLVARLPEGEHAGLDEIAERMEALYGGADVRGGLK